MLRIAQHRGLAGTIALVAAGSAACVKQLPPAATPVPIAPAVDLSAPPAGQGRLVVDVVDGPTPVHRIQMRSQPIADDAGQVRYRLVEAPELLCPASPCVAEVPPGNVLLGFPVRGDADAMETELVHIDAGTSVYRRALSVYDDRRTSVGGVVGASIGGTALFTGVALLPIGLAEDIDGLTIAGGVSMGAGALLLTWGILAIRRSADTFRPGAANHYSLP